MEVDVVPLDPTQISLCEVSAAQHHLIRVVDPKVQTGKIAGRKIGTAPRPPAIKPFGMLVYCVVEFALRDPAAATNGGCLEWRKAKQRSGKYCSTRDHQFNFAFGPASAVVLRMRKVVSI